MVDLAEIQAAYYMVAATGVLVAAAYYVINMRAVMKAREMEACRFLTDRMTSESTMQSYTILIGVMEWKDYDDFMKKYGYSNPEIFAKWTSWFFLADTLGYQIRNRLVRSETVYDLGGYGLIRLWERYKEIILLRRDAAWGRDYFSGFEFVASEMLRIKNARDARFKGMLDTYRTTLKPV
jgi:hypothetical protein